MEHSHFREALVTAQTHSRYRAGDLGLIPVAVEPVSELEYALVCCVRRTWVLCGGAENCKRTSTDQGESSCGFLDW
jgi:hypothetical protein